MVSWRRLYCLWYVRRACNCFAAFAAVLFISSAILRVFQSVLRSPKESRELLNDSRVRVVFKEAISKSLDVKGGSLNQTEICVRKFGRFGNQMFQVAALLGVAHRKNMKPFLETNSDLVGIFRFEDVDILPTNKCEQFQLHHEIRPAAFDLRSMEVDSAKDIALAGYFQSWRYFDGISDVVRRQFTLRGIIYKEAMRVFAQILQNQIHTLSDISQSELIALHVRRGDLTNPDRRQYGNDVAPASYIHAAMMYFRIKLKKVIFVASSDDMNWVRSHVTAPDVVYLEGRRADVDFAILSQCDHAIVTVGTYGWWVAWMVNGITVYYKHPYIVSSYLYNNTNMEDFIPSSWIGMK